MSTARDYIDITTGNTGTTTRTVTIVFPDYPGADAQLASWSRAKLRLLIRAATLYNLGMMLGDWGHIDLTPAELAMACELELMRRGAA